MMSRVVARSNLGFSASMRTKLCKIRKNYASSYILVFEVVWKEILFLNLFLGFDFIIYTVLQCDLPPIRPHFGEAPGRDSNPGRAARGRDTTPRPPHLL